MRPGLTAQERIDAPPAHKPHRGIGGSQGAVERNDIGGEQVPLDSTSTDADLERVIYLGNGEWREPLDYAPNHSARLPTNAIPNTPTDDSCVPAESLG